MKERTRLLAASHLGTLTALAGLGAGWVVVASLLAEPPHSLPAWSACLVALALMASAGWAGWAFRQAWIYPRTLRKAEILWAEGTPPEGVEALLNTALLARGELGFRIHLLRGCALLAQGHRQEAWASCIRAELARLPFPVRWLVAGGFRPLPSRDRDRQFSKATWLLRLAPRTAHLFHLAAALTLQKPDPGSRTAALALLRNAVMLGPEDPLLLEDAMLAAWSEGDVALAELALGRLLARHQDPRLPWDRAAGAAILLRSDRAAEAAALLAAVPAERRNGPEIWALETAARRRLGDLEGAEAALEQGLDKHPQDFRLWMESHALAMADRSHEDALADLEEARKCLAGEDSALIWEWELRRAEFAWWVDGDAEQAMQHLAQVPPDLRGPQVPPLGLFLRAALGEQAGVLTEIEVLEGLHPDNLGVRILHGDCLARLQAWEPLAAYLESLDENTRQRPEFRHLRGTLLAHTQRLLEAREELERAAGMDSDNLRFVLDAGHACAELGEWERSEAHWQQALRLDEACGEALLELAESRMAVHDRAGALRFLRECLLHHPEAQEAQLRLAQLESH